MPNFSASCACDFIVVDTTYRIRRSRLSNCEFYVKLMIEVNISGCKIVISTSANFGRFYIAVAYTVRRSKCFARYRLLVALKKSNLAYVKL